MLRPRRSPGALVIEADAAPFPLPVRAGPRLEALPLSAPCRVVMLAKRKAHTRVAAHWRRALRARGHRVLWLRPGRWKRLLGRRAPALLARCVGAFGPDLLWIYKHDASPELLDRLPKTLPRVVYYEDVPARLDDPGERLLAVARRATLLTTTAEGMIPTFTGLGVPRAIYLRGGVDPRDHRPGRRRLALESETAFIGQAGGPDRLALLSAVAERGGLKLYGRGWRDALGVVPTLEHVYPRQYRDVCASARIVLGQDLHSDVAAYFSNRTWLTLGCRGFLLTRYVPRLEEFFTNHQHLVWFREVDEALELIAHYGPREAERRRIARQGHAYVHAHHTFQHAVEELFSALG